MGPKSRGLSLLIGVSKPKSPREEGDHGDSGMPDEEESGSMHEAIAGDMMEAIKSDDSDELSRVIRVLIDSCRGGR